MKKVLQVRNPLDGRVLVAPDAETLAQMEAEFRAGLPEGATVEEVASEAELVMPEPPPMEALT